MSALEELTVPELRFVELIAEKEATGKSKYECYLEAFTPENVTPRSAATLAWRLLREDRIQAALAELREEVLDDAIASLTELRVRLTQVIRADITDIVAWDVDESGNISPRVKSLDDVPPEHRRLIKSITYTKNGPKLELLDTQKAMDMLIRMQGGYAPERVELSGRDGGAIVTREMTQEEATELYRKNLNAAG